MAKVKHLVMNAQDLWAALSDCSQMTLLRKYFIRNDVYADANFSDAIFDDKGNVIFKVTHDRFPSVDEGKIPTIKLPKLMSRAERMGKNVAAQ